MTSEEAINNLIDEDIGRYCYNCDDKCDNCDYFIARETAVKALKKQVPQTPKTEGARFSKIELCPTCGSFDITDSGDLHNNKYCPNCGQAIKWGD